MAPDRFQHWRDKLDRPSKDRVAATPSPSSKPPPPPPAEDDIEELEFCAPAAASSGFSLDASALNLEKIAAQIKRLEGAGPAQLDELKALQAELATLKGSLQEFRDGGGGLRERKLTPNPNPKPKSILKTAPRPHVRIRPQCTDPCCPPGGGGYHLGLQHMPLTAGWDTLSAEEKQLLYEHYVERGPPGKRYGIWGRYPSVTIVCLIVLLLMFWVPEVLRLGREVRSEMMQRQR